MKLSNTPDNKEKVIAVNKLGPKASLCDFTLNKFEHVNTDSEATELIVPAAQPTRCACISSAGWISIFTDVSRESAIVLVITGWIPVKENIVITSGVNAKSDHEGKIADSRKRI